MSFSISSIGILSPVVAISVTSKRRPPRPRSPPPSAPLHLRTAATTQLPARVGKQVVETHSSRIERYAARGGGAEWVVGTRRVKEKQTRRMVAQATGSAAPLVSAPHTPSQHRSKDHVDASVTHWGALPWPTRPVGSGQHTIAVSIALVAAAAAASFRAD